jgi:Kef-type K+ transport system membrane component KefB
MTHGAVARVVLGLVLTLALAMIVAHPRVRALANRVGLNAIASTGVTFVVIGALFHLPAVGILGPNVLRHLQPAFEFGLGWIGFTVGMQFDLRALDRLPRGIAGALALQAIAPMATVAIACGSVLFAITVKHPQELVRPIIVLCACAAASAAIEDASRLQARYGEAAARILRDLTNLDEIVALAVLGLVSVYFRPRSATVYWQLPASAWLLVALGVGALLGIVTFVLLRGARRLPERIALLIGAIAFASGMAGYLSLSVPVIGAMAGALLANLPVPDADGLRKILSDFERPLYLFFLVIVGASWHPSEWQGWAIAGAFTIARVYGKVLGSRLAVRAMQGLPPARVVANTLMHQSPIAVVVIVAAGAASGGEQSAIVHWSINAVIVSAALTEVLAVLVRKLLERTRSPLEPPSGLYEVT